jgi:hypothetical protein
MNKTVWVISRGNPAKKQLKKILGTDEEIHGYDYKISDLGNYLLKPRPLEVERTVVGYEVVKKDSLTFPFLSFLKKNKSDDNIKQYISSLKLNLPEPGKDKVLSHFIRDFGYELARHDTIITTLKELDLTKVEKINVLYEDIDSNVLPIPIQGNPDEQRRFVLENYGRKIKVIWNNGSYLDDGIFNLKPEEFLSYNGQKSFRLFLFTHEGKKKAFVYSGNVLHYWIKDPELLRYLIVLQQTLNMDQEFYLVMRACLRHEYQALYIEFNRKPVLDIFSRYTPYVYDNAFKLLQISQIEQKNIITSLGDFLENVGLKYLKKQDRGSRELMLKMTFLHTINGVSHLKEINPGLYQTIRNLSTESEIGHYYVLDKKILKIGAL